MSAFIQPDGTIRCLFHSYVVENNKSQLLTHAETLALKRDKKILLPK